MEQSESIKELATALAEAQGELKNVVKSGKGNYGKYAELGVTLDEVRPITSKHGLAIIQLPILLEDGTTGLTTQVLHKSGEWIRGTYPVRMQQQTPQGQGSAITYARRYTLSAVLGIAGDDDDGQAGSEGKNPEKPKAKPADDAATLTQKAKIRDLLLVNGVLAEDMKGYLIEQYGIKDAEHMSKQDASSVIDMLNGVSNG